MNTRIMRIITHHFFCCAEKYHFSADPTLKNSEGCHATKRTAPTRLWCVVTPGPAKGVDDFEANVRVQLGGNECTGLRVLQIYRGASCCI